MVDLSKDYVPHKDEPFMNDRQREYFKRKLLVWRDEIIHETKETITSLQTESSKLPDISDRATAEADKALELRARDRQRKLIGKIDEALRSIENKTYGYCEQTGEPIELERLIARPIATLSLEAQQRHETQEKIYVDEDE